MTIKEVVEQSKLYFGKNRQRLKKKLIAFELDGKEYRAWKKNINQFTSQPCEITYGMFDDVVEWLKAKEFSEINWKWLGDLSWEFKFLLNTGIDSGLDWDRKLALKCGGTARIVQIYVSDIVPCFVIDTYYMTYSKKENYWEFGPIDKLSVREKTFIKQAKTFFQKAGFIYLDQENALKRYNDLYSDCNSDGNARLFDVLFSDTQNYQLEIKRFSDKQLKDYAGKTISWNEYYDDSKKLRMREEFRFYPSKNVDCVVTDALGRITNVRVWRDIDKLRHHEFHLDILKEHQMSQKSNTRDK